MKVKIKKLHDDAVIPVYSKQGDAGMDLVAVSKYIDENQCDVFGTGLSFEIPVSFVGLLFPRSSNAKKELVLTNSVGVLDSGYRGEVMFKYRDLHLGMVAESSYNIGDRIGQLIIIPYPTIEFEEVTELSETERGVGGYGSTGK